MALSFVVVAVVSAFAVDEGAAQGDDVDIRIFSSDAGGGALVTAYDFSSPQPVFRTLCAGGTCLYATTNPGFRTAAQSEPDGGLYALTSGTQVTVEVIEVAAGASAKFGSRVLRAPGEQALLGSAPGVHIHPSWQLTIPEGTTGSFLFRFRLTATNGYAASAPYDIVLTNAAEVQTPTPSPSSAPTPTTTAAPPTLPPSPTAVPESPTPTLAAPTSTSTRRPTPVPTSTATRAPSFTPTPRLGPRAGDVDCDGRVGAADVLGLALLVSSPPATPPCGADAVEDGVVDELDLAETLKAVFQP